MAEANQEPGPPSSARGTWIKLSVAAALALAIVGVSYFYGDHFSTQRIVGYKEALDAFRAEHPILVYGLAFAAYVLVTGLSLPGAAAMTLLYGALFGFWRTVILVSFASTTGATVAFLISRYLLRDAVQGRFGNYLGRFNEALQREGAFYLFTLRLIPAVPFFVINLVMGLTPLKTRTYWWVSQLGMLPGTCVYVFAGSTLDVEKLQGEAGLTGILSWQLIVAFCLLGVFPLAVKRIMARVRPQQDQA